jgi:hypothetical protein
MQMGLHLFANNPGASRLDFTEWEARRDVRMILTLLAFDKNLNAHAGSAG